MKIIIGLGNPGKKYESTRHNVGFMMIDHILNQVISEKLKVKSNSDFKYDKYLKSQIAEVNIYTEKVVLVKPQTFMNESGLAVTKIVSKYEILDTKYLFIVHDDLDLPLGEYKIQLARGPKLHYGIQSIEKYLKTDDFWRVRIGVDNRSKESRVNGEAYVLQTFNNDELSILNSVMKELANQLTLNI